MRAKYDEILSLNCYAVHKGQKFEFVNVLTLFVCIDGFGEERLFFDFENLLAVFSDLSDAFVLCFNFLGGASQVKNCYSSVTSLVSGRWDVENDEVVALKSFMEDRCMVHSLFVFEM